MAPQCLHTDALGGMQAIILDHETKPGQTAEQWQAYHHPRFSHIIVEHLYCVGGPSHTGATRMTAAAILDYLALSLGSSFVHVVQVRPPAPLASCAYFENQTCMICYTVTVHRTSARSPGSRPPLEHAPDVVLASVVRSSNGLTCAARVRA